MGETYNVRLEPVGIDFEVDEDETVLRGAFRQGLMLMHGCKEGQCSACKSFLLDGEVDLDRYSTFALNDFEKEEGWTLLCRAHAVSDLEVELINYDEEILRSGVPQQTKQLRVDALEALTHDIYRLVLDATDLEYHPGQYVDITIPGTEEVRSFSMANLPGDKLEFMIKVYPDGKFSSLLTEGGIEAGHELEVTGPFGVFTLRKNERPLLFIGGGAGMAPILALLRSLADEDSTTGGRLLLRGARPQGSLSPGRAGRARTAPGELPLCPRAVRLRREGGMGRRAGPDHRRGRALRAGAG